MLRMLYLSAALAVHARDDTANPLNAVLHRRSPLTTYYA